MTKSRAYLSHAKIANKERSYDIWGVLLVLAIGLIANFSTSFVISSQSKSIENTYYPGTQAATNQTKNARVLVYDQ